MAGGRPVVEYCEKHKVQKERNKQGRYKCLECKRESENLWRAGQKDRINAARRARRKKPETENRGRHAVPHCEKHDAPRVPKIRPDGSRYYYCSKCNVERTSAYRASHRKVRPPTRQQLALELSDLGFTITEIAENLGCTVHQASEARSRAALADNRREKQEKPGPSGERYYLDAMDKKAEEVWARKADPKYYGVRAVWHSSAIRDMEIGL